MKKGLIALIGFLALATFFFWGEHQAHIVAVLPWALLLLCPFLHFFMHGGHGGHGSHEGHGGAGDHAKNHGGAGTGGGR